MSDNASRIFNVLKHTAEDVKDTGSNLVTLIVKSIDPLEFNLDDKLTITKEFYALDKNFDTSIISAGDKVKAITLSNNQIYYLLANKDASAGAVTDVKINGNSVVSNNIANFLTKSNYNANTNKIATENDIPATIDIQINGNSIIANNVANIVTEGEYNPSTNKIATKNAIPTNANIVDLIYPVGSIYITVNSTNPGTLFGGTWEQIKDKFLLSAGDDYSAGSTGGEATHTLTIDEMPSHSHKVSYLKQEAGNDYQFCGGVGNWQTTGHSNTNIENTGGGQAHNNMPPYLAVYVWKRTA